jgi:hypothetical protein
MPRQIMRPSPLDIAVGLTATLLLVGPARALEGRSASENNAGPVVRNYGTEGGYRTEVRSEKKGTLSEENRRQSAVLTAQVFRHIHEARRALDADDAKLARQEVEKGRQALKAIRSLLPRMSVHTTTKAPDGKVVYEDDREVQQDRVPLFEGMLHERTLAPILAAKRDAVEVTGIRLVGSETLVTEAVADLDIMETQLGRAAKALENHKTDEAAKALTAAQVRGVEFFSSREDTPLAEARDALWLARRSFEENNPAQARANLDMARQRLRVYREVAPQERRGDVDQMLKETDQLEAQLRQETAQQPATHAERASQGSAVTRWWEEVNRWFKRHL